MNLFAQNNLSVEVTGLVPDKGNVILGLYNKKIGFLENGFGIANVKVKATGDRIVYTFKYLPDGEYAVAVYQDENSNGKCDRNMIGYPTEGFGFSKNFRPKFSVPKFDEVKIAVWQSVKTNIVLIQK
ncbi:DUF2141 domain-containing protein [Flavobacterium sp. 17A]|uniref:DUF2141 domain-containing protein n=2 Tax=Flavobacterium potami TaxID=2872310 RepID=A0A9X1H8Q4_9FLAO|nr:DUF2141 domain-containing protein [Flavobacterium potami]